MAAPSPLTNRPPVLQQVAQNINQVVAPATRSPIVDELAPVLAFGIDVSQVVRRIFWSSFVYTVVGVNKFIFGLFPRVPQGESRKYLNVWFNEQTVDPNMRLSVIYPSQGVIPEDVGGTIAAADAGQSDTDFLGAGRSDDKRFWPLLPVEIYPLGRLAFRTDQTLTTGQTLKIFYVWERLAAPATAQAEPETLLFTEA